MATSYWKADSYRVNHVGWLLSASSPSNIATGEKLLAEMPHNLQEKAKARAKKLTALYAQYANPHIAAIMSTKR